MKCTLCGKHIENPKYYNGKSYGTNCYKLIIATEKARLQAEQNSEYNKRCVVILSVLKDKVFKNDWWNSFKESVLKQWQECGKLTYLQLKKSQEKFNDTEKFLVEYRIASIEEDEKRQKCLYHDCFGHYNYYSCFVKLRKLSEFKHLLNVKFKDGYFWARDIEDDDTKQFVLPIKELDDYKLDKYMIITEIVKY